MNNAKLPKPKIFHHRFGLHECSCLGSKTHIDDSLTRVILHTCERWQRKTGGREPSKTSLTSKLLDNLIKHLFVFIFCPTQWTNERTIQQIRDVSKLKGFTHILASISCINLTLDSHRQVQDFKKQEFTTSFIGRRSVNLDKLTLISFANFFSFFSFDVHFREITSTSSSLHG